MSVLQANLKKAVRIGFSNLLLLAGLLFGCPLRADELALRHLALTESSGVAVSDDDFVIWSHNDSGDSARMFAFGRDGRPLAEFQVPLARARDWEDMCSFSTNDGRFLAIADVGDNQQKRGAVEIYIVKEPESKDVDEKLRSVGVAARIRVTYPSGPVNCEAIAYDPKREVFLLLSKEFFRCRIFEVDASKLEGERAVQAKLSQTIVFPMATGADISRDGEKLVLCSYGAGALYVRNSKGQWETPPNRDSPIIELPRRRQGESICFADDGTKLLLTSEFTPCQLFEIACPEVETQAD